MRRFISSPLWVDVHEAVATQFVSTSGLGLKAVAPVAGFTWRDSEAGGEASLGWYRGAQAARGAERDAGRARILAYNEDDVRALRALRLALTHIDLPGSVLELESSTHAQA